MINRNSSKDYLETILILHRKNGFARSIDISREMGVSKPSVCNAMKKLRDRELIYFGDNGYIHLTEGGMSIAQTVYNKRMVLAKILTDIGVSEDKASREAGYIEHAISDDTFNCLSRFIYNRTHKLAKANSNKGGRDE
ncbi:MAG: metal-dependent transcriptional regulator [Lachnospiraceae bacterium]|nr:metal-dependent transcriptional regulator [Lachnospiraceae bacterium]